MKDCLINHYYNNNITSFSDLILYCGYCCGKFGCIYEVSEIFSFSSFKAKGESQWILPIFILLFNMSMRTSQFGSFDNSQWKVS
jgi:hypothetical protein